MAGHSVREAAADFHVHVGTIRKWIRNGCPTLELGSVGRSHGSRLDLQEVAQWLLTKKVPMLAKRSDDETLSIIATALDDWLKRDGWAGRTVQTERAALSFYERVYKNLTHQQLELKVLPDAMKLIHSIYLDSVELTGSFQRRR